MRGETSGTRAIMRRLAVGGLMVLSLHAWPAPIRAQTPPGAPASPPVAAPPQAPDVSAADVESLRERAAAFWAARVALDAAKQWEFLEPRGRGRMSVAEYTGAPRAVKYLAYQVEEANIRGYFGTVKVRLIVQPVLPTAPQRRIAPAAVVVEDAWVRVRGTWYRSLEQEESRKPPDAQQ